MAGPGTCLRDVSFTYALWTGRRDELEHPQQSNICRHLTQKELKTKRPLSDLDVSIGI